MGSKDITITMLDQPDIPFLVYYIPVGNDKAIEVYYDPTELEARIVSTTEMKKRVFLFDGAMHGEEPS